LQKYAVFHVSSNNNNNDVKLKGFEWGKNVKLFEPVELCPQWIMKMNEYFLSSF